MSELNALAQKLSALAGKDDTFRNGARIISQGGVPNPMNAMLKAVDETMLERKLAFVTGKHTINIIAAGRRLRGIASASPSAGDISHLVGKSIAREEPDLVDDAYAFLSDTIGNAASLSVHSLPSEPLGKGGEPGISAFGLADLWQVDMDETPLPPMERFLRVNSASISAMLHVNNGEVVADHGDIDALSDIWNTQVTAFIEAQSKLPRQSDGPQLICLDGALEDGSATAVAIAGDEVALLVYEPAQLGTLHSTWQSIFA
jgi:hypothetical protein